MRRMIFRIEANLYQQISRFGLIGFSNVVIDLSIYTFLMANGVGIVQSKAVAFVGGTFFAFYANRSWTFESNQRGVKILMLFFSLYTFSMFLNVWINFFISETMQGIRVGLVMAYGAAVLTSSFVNFVGMRFLFYSLDTKRKGLC